MSEPSGSNARTRHAAFYIRKAVEISKRFHGTTAHEASKEADQYWPQIRHAIEWLVETANQNESGDQLVRLLREASGILNLRAKSEERVAWLEQVQKTANGSAHEHLETSVLASLGNFYRNLGRIQDSQITLRRAMCKARVSGDRFEEMRSCAFLGYTLQHRRKHQSAPVMYGRAASIANELGKQWWNASMLLMTARCEHVLGRAQAVTTLEKAEGIATQLGEHRLQATIHELRASIAIDVDDTSAATKALYQAIEHAEIVNDHWNLATCYTSLGRILEDEERLEEALEIFNRALTSGRRIGSVAGNFRRQLYIARVLRELGRHSEALASLDDANRTPMHRSLGNVRDIQLETARCYEALGERKRARKAFATTLRMGRRAREPRKMGLIYDDIESHCVDAGDFTGALRWNVRALGVSSQLNELDWVQQDLTRIEELLEEKTTVATPRTRAQLSAAIDLITDDGLRRQAAELRRKIDHLLVRPRKGKEDVRVTG